MLVFRESYAVITDGNVRLLAFPPAVENGPFAGLIWSPINSVKEISGFGLDGLLDVKFDCDAPNGAIATLTLQRMFPPALRLRDWIPNQDSGWLPLGDETHYIRVSPVTTSRSSPGQATISHSAEHWYVLYNVHDDTIAHERESALWGDTLGIPEDDVIAAQSLACSRYDDLIRVINEADAAA